MNIYDQIISILTLIPLIIPLVAVLWKIYKNINQFIVEQETVKKTVQEIKAEVTHNGGKSIKDVVNSLKMSLERIEARQKILDQRSKTALQYDERALFEIDKTGRLIWSNESFQQLTKKHGNIRGYDWLALINEEDRETFINEIKSCLQMCRKIAIETETVDDESIGFLGFPYKSDHDSHEGFLIHVYTGEIK